jgi:putative SOS response-associated peptidase YedK
MCGRFTLHSSGKIVGSHFGLAEEPTLFPRYNIAPTQQVAAVRASRQLVPLRWGLVPSWADDLSIGNRLLNARSETVAAKPAFRSAFRQRRCLIPADGFYEWQASAGKKQPYLIALQERQPFAIAGLWETWDRSGQVVESCTLLTTSANELVGRLHGTMTVMVRGASHVILLWRKRRTRHVGAAGQ